MADPTHDVTRLLLAWQDGDPQALDKLMPQVLGELRRMAGAYFAGEAAGHTLQPTALINEVYLRLVDAGRVEWQCRAHFFGIAARLMRCVLVDHARGRGAAKRGGGALRTELSIDQLLPQGRTVDLLALDDALSALADFNPEGSQIVELRFFGGLNFSEIAEIQGVSRTTIKRRWRTAKIWLYRELNARDATAVAADEEVSAADP